MTRLPNLAFMRTSFHEWRSASAGLIRGITLAVFLAWTLPAQAGGKADVFAVELSSAAAEGKLSNGLLEVADNARNAGTPLGRAPGADKARTSGDAILVEVLLNPGDGKAGAYNAQGADGTHDFEALTDLAGVEVRFVSQKYHQAILAVRDPDTLIELSRLDIVRRIRPLFGAVSNAGSVTSRASTAMGADLARTTFSVDGSGEVIGIISDSFARTLGVRDGNTMPPPGVAGTLTGAVNQDSGDLPPTVTILRDDADLTAQGGPTDEGAALAELIHDVAPGAAIAFHTGFLGAAGFAEAIDRLCAEAGCTVIIDDITVFSEPMYQDGLIAQAAKRAFDGGTNYVSSAVNLANRGFTRIFTDIDPGDDTDDDELFPVSGTDLHDWGGGDGFLDVTLDPGEGFTAILQWNQPHDAVSAGNGAQMDLDLYITSVANPTGLDTFGASPPIDSGFDTQGTTGLPGGDALEIVSYTNATGLVRTVFLAVDHFVGNQEFIPQNGATAVEFRLIFVENTGTNLVIQDIADASSSQGGPTIWGQGLVTGAVSIGAAAWFEAPAFDPTLGPTALIDPEADSSRGGSIDIHFNGAGAFSARTVFRPDVTAVTSNNNTFFGIDLNLGGTFGEPDALPNFSGTSAAAAHAAAVMALIREVEPRLSATRVRNHLVDTAIDIAGLRAAPGVDDVTGTGLIDAFAAVEAASEAIMNAATTWELYE